MRGLLFPTAHQPDFALSKIRLAAGFSFIELIITVAIMGVIATVVLPMMEVSIQQSKEQELRAALRQIREGIDAYKQAVVDEKIDVGDDDSGYPKTLESLVDGVPDASSLDGKKLYFLRRIPPDPMYDGPTTAPSLTWGKRSYASPPSPPSAGADIYDVYSLSTHKGLNGIPYNEW